jgi:ribonuclease D
MKKKSSSLEIFERDLPNRVTNSLIHQSLQIDTETDGLDYRKDKLRAVTIANTDNQTYIVKEPDWNSENLKEAIGYNLILPRVFHHAFFDLCFLKAGLGINPPQTIHCTKILMKMLYPDILSGLGSSLREILGVKINKKIDHSKWKNQEWSARQKEYMVGDTLYLYDLCAQLCAELTLEQSILYDEARKAIKSKVIIEVEGYTDLLDYSQVSAKESKRLREWWKNIGD